jgi:hypothetical protein
MGFTIKAIHIYLNAIQEGQPLYVEGWATKLHTLGVNTLRFSIGGYGDTWGLNMIENPSTWAASLNALLTVVDAAGFKCWFQSLGDPWGGLFGIDALGLEAGTPPAMVAYDQTRTNNLLTDVPSNYGKNYIDALGDAYVSAGDQHHNFLTDSRILFWAVDNECMVGTLSGGAIVTNDNYTWITMIQDYIRSKGGLVIANAPRFDGWDIRFQYLVPIFEGHADYIEFHEYGQWYLCRTEGEDGDYTNWCDNGDGTFNWSKWVGITQPVIAEKIAYRGVFPRDHIIAGEFGLWHGHGADGANDATFNDVACRAYYSNMFQMLVVEGVVNASPFVGFNRDNPPYSGDYGILTVPLGTQLAGCAEIIDAYVTSVVEPYPVLPWNETFNSGMYYWTSQAGTWGVSGNVLAGSGGYDVLAIAGNPVWADYSVTTNVMIMSGVSNVEASVVVRFENTSNFYWMGLGLFEHQYSIAKFVDGVYTELVSSGTIASVQTNTTYKIRAVVYGNILQLYVDDVKVLETTDTSHVNGAIGFRTWNSDVRYSGVEVLSEYVVVANQYSGSVIAPNGNVVVGVGANKKFDYWTTMGHHLGSVVIDGSSNVTLLSAGAYTFSGVLTSHSISVYGEINPPIIVSGLFIGWNVVVNL